MPDLIILRYSDEIELVSRVAVALRKSVSVSYLLHVCDSLASIPLGKPRTFERAIINHLHPNVCDVSSSV